MWPKALLFSLYTKELYYRQLHEDCKKPSQGFPKKTTAPWNTQVFAHKLLWSPLDQGVFFMPQTNVDVDKNCRAMKKARFRNASLFWVGKEVWWWRQWWRSKRLPNWSYYVCQLGGSKPHLSIIITRLFWKENSQTVDGRISCTTYCTRNLIKMRDSIFTYTHILTAFPDVFHQQYPY